MYSFAARSDNWPVPVGFKICVEGAPFWGR